MERKNTKLTHKKFAYELKAKNKRRENKMFLACGEFE